LRILGNILTGNDEQSTEVLKTEALDVFFSLLIHKDIIVLREVVWIFSNVVAGKSEFVYLITNNPIYVERLIYLMNAGFINESVLF